MPAAKQQYTDAYNEAISRLHQAYRGDQVGSKTEVRGIERPKASGAHSRNEADCRGARTSANTRLRASKPPPEDLSKFNAAMVQFISGN